MNKRIREIIEQAGFTVMRGYGLKESVPEDVFIANVCVSNEMKKFAELIVEECLDLVSYGGEFCSRPKLVEKIKEHFGVEE